MIEVVRETGSTSADLATRLARGEYVPERHWLVADRQTGGQGRGGREWRDGAGNFMGSTVVHRRHGDPPAATLSLVAGLAAHEALIPHAPGALLKWPNDIMVGTAKLAGILCLTCGNAVIVGIGVNLAHAPEIDSREIAALATPPARDAFADQLEQAFDRELGRWRGFGIEPLARRWTAAAHPDGTPLTVETPEGALVGIFGGLAEDGALLLRLADGATRAIHAGEVRLAG